MGQTLDLLAESRQESAMRSILAHMATTLAPVTAVPAHELVLEQLRRSIHLGQFVAGDKLPPERELARQLGVSRTTVREAVRVLEEDGMVEIRRGSTGGIIVRTRTTRPAELVRRLRECEDILDFRIAVETAAARLAAQRRTAADIAALDRAFQAVEQVFLTGAVDCVSVWVRVDTDFHVMIARIARNEYLAAAVEDARANMFMPIGVVFGHLTERAHDQHRELRDAICAGDPGRAAEAARNHIESTRADIHHIARLSRTRRGRRPPRARSTPAAPE
jgi:GntR family transcriptional regulator, transcriptional repressor for pyruvate dehydrogenase complex